LAQRYLVYAKTGNVSTEIGELPESGVPVGTADSETFSAKKTELETQVEGITKEIKRWKDEFGGRADQGVAGQAIGKLEAELTAAQSNLEALGQGAETLPQIRQNTATGHLSGSDLLTEVSYRDLAQRHGNTLFRSAENQAVAAITQAENFNTQAGYLENAAAYNTWTSILGGAMKIAGTAAAFT
jgi:hypothetical protein